MKADGTQGLYIDLRPGSAPPEVDGFIVSVGRAGAIGTVYHVAEVREVKPRPGTTRKLVRWQMRVYKANDLKPTVHRNPANGSVWVGDKRAIGITWYRRAKKKRP